MRTSDRHRWQIVCLFVALTLFFAYPVWVRPASRVLWMGDDTNLFAWTLAWDAHAFVHQPLSIFDANIYFPQRWTLAYSENLIGSAVLAAPVLWLTGNPVLAINLVGLISCALCGIGAYVLARRLHLGVAGAVLVGIIFAFSPPRFLRLGQLHLTTVQWVPFALASLHDYLETGRPRALKWTAALVTAQVFTSGHGAVFVVLAIGVVLAWRVALGEPIRPLQRLNDLGVIGILLLVPTVLVWLPYHDVQVQMGLRRTLADWEPDPASFLSSPAHVHRFLLSLVPQLGISGREHAALFPGFLPHVLCLLGLWCAWRRRGTGTPRPADAWWQRAAGAAESLIALAVVVGVGAAIAGGGAIRVGRLRVASVQELWRPWAIAGVGLAVRVLMLRRVPFVRHVRLWAWGRSIRPRLRRWWLASGGWRIRRDAWRQHVVPPYVAVLAVSLLMAAPRPISIWPLVYWLPGLNFVRVPGRMTILALLALAVLAGAAFDRLSARLAPRRRLLAGVLTAVLVGAELVTMPLEPLEYRIDIPAIDRWLDTRPKPFAVAELPVGNPDDGYRFERRQATFMLHSMAHWQKTIHAFSGFRPTLHELLFAQMAEPPNEETMRRLAALGVTYLVVHTDLYRPGEWPAVEARLAALAPLVRLEHVEGPGRVYSLHR